MDPLVALYPETSLNSIVLSLTLLHNSVVPNLDIWGEVKDVVMTKLHGLTYICKSGSQFCKPSSLYYDGNMRM